MKGESGIKSSDESDIQIIKINFFQKLTYSPHISGHR